EEARRPQRRPVRHRRRAQVAAPFSRRPGAAQGQEGQKTGPGQRRDDQDRLLRLVNGGFMRRFALACGIAVLCASPSRAQDSSIEEAKAHAARAKVHYDLGEYEKAADEYILVYRIRPLPALLYNIAQSYRQAGQYDKARQFYKSYLREAKDAPNRDAIERAIREIDDLLAKEKKAKDGPPKGVAQTPGVSGAGNAAAGLIPPPVTGTAAPSTAATSAPQPSGA